MLDLVFQFTLEFVRALLVDALSGHVRRRLTRMFRNPTTAAVRYWPSIGTRGSGFSQDAHRAGAGLVVFHTFPALPVSEKLLH